MIDQLESDYNCSNAGEDLESLQNELKSLLSSAEASGGKRNEEQFLRLENQIHFIKNKCNIRP